jgi:phosphopantetheinyl transferase (holo-ACP synthase)
MLKMNQKSIECQQPEVESTKPQLPNENQFDNVAHSQTETPSVDAAVPTSHSEASHFGTLTDKDFEKFKYLRISDAMVKRVQIRRVTDFGARKELGIDSKEIKGDLSGIVIPYFDPSDATRTTVRLKRDNPEIVDEKKQGKYRSPAGLPKPLYFVPGVNYDDPQGVIVLVESELSAIAIAALAERTGRNLLPIAMGGCTGWLTPVEGPDGEKLYSIPLVDLDICIGRPVVLVFDENAATNPDIRMARAKLAFWLESERYKATVRIATVPRIKEASGPDDLIAEKGDEEFLKMLDDAGSVQTVAVADAKAAIESVDKMNLDERQFKNAASAVAFVSDSFQSEILKGQLAKALNGSIPKEIVTKEISACNDSWQRQKTKLAQQVQEEMATGLTAWELAAVLEKIRNYVLRFVVFSNIQASIIIAIFVAYSYLWEIFDFAPYINVKSPEKRCGKTRVLEVLKVLVRKPWFTQRTTRAALVRKLSSEKLVLLLDENDQALKDKEYAAALIQVLNAGFQKGGNATVCVGNGADIKVVDFNVFGPKVLAGIGNLPDTIEDRSIPILLKRRLPSEPVERFRQKLIAKEAADIRKSLENLVTQTIKTQLTSNWPDLPSELSDRQQDIAEPLLAVADYAGPEWGDLARAALVELFGSTSEDGSLDVRLLTDIRSIFVEGKVACMASKDLVSALIAIEGSPWPESEHGKPLTTTALARRLKKFKIGPRSIRNNGKLVPIGIIPADIEGFKGYLLTDFKEAFERYCPAVTPQQSTVDGLQTGCNPSVTEGIASTDAACNSVTAVTVNTEEQEVINADPLGNEVTMNNQEKGNYEQML